MGQRFSEWLQAEVNKWPTIVEFAERVGVRDSAVHAWLRRRIIPRPGTEDKLAEVSGVDRDYVLSMMNEARKEIWGERLDRARARSTLQLAGSQFRARLARRRASERRRTQIATTIEASREWLAKHSHL